jgi:hypothetical protein
MYGRWAISDAGDMSKGADFLHVIDKANTLARDGMN